MMKANVLEVSTPLKGLCLSAINIHSVKIFEVLTSFPFNKLIYLKKKKSSFKQQKITFCHVTICFSNENKVI